MSSPSNILSMRRGDDFSFDVMVVDPITGDPRDLTGTRMWFTAKASFFDDDDDAIIAKDDSSGITYMDPEAGHARVFIDAADTDEFTKRRVLRFDVQWRDDNDFLHTVSTGDLVVELDVTRRTS